ncbi:RCC1 domain-containing protein [Haliangium ochraceum]|uniref:BNR repeat-containing protein n=1 Tax=Haliangium ochraceum (strain DSM 14365 / JCM 11303 / SMP-2) TaxID=502025 RepID=D0LPL7_HALO1|nr:BNR repeat-containing protein [Haliangium ochraceum]ACY15380.1 BNR repeat-containing protein [Haliangium ochraceum DSM 14365]
MRTGAVSALWTLLVTALVAALVAGCPKTEQRSASPQERELPEKAARANAGDAHEDAGPATRRVAHLAAGYTHTCVLFEDGGVRCWGKGANGRLGTGAAETIGDDETPAAIADVALGGWAVQISAGDDHACALLDTGKLRCWGGNRDGQLGYGHTRDIGDDETPASAGDVPLDEAVAQVVAGSAYTCALLESGRVRCWGASPEGETGLGLDGRTIGDDEAPTAVPALELGGRVTQLAGATGMPCALLEGGAVRCWGAVAGSSADRHTPAAEHPPVALGANAARIAAGVGGLRACAMSERGRVRCWGGGVSGLVGYAREIDDVGVSEAPTPAQLGDVPLAGEARVRGVGLGAKHSCVALDDGGVRCWGEPRFGVLGPGRSGRVMAADAAAIDIGGRVDEIAAGGFHTCAVLDTGSVRCWGRNADGQLGYGTAENVGELRSVAAVGDVPL